MANASYTAPQSTYQAGLTRGWIEAATGQTKPAPCGRSLVLLVLLAALALLLSGCAKPLLVCPRTVKVPAPPIPTEHASLVFFATDRLPATGEGLAFSEELNPADDPMSYGSICANPTGGQRDCNSASRLLDKEQFLQRIRATHSDVVLFVHGFNYTFDESVETTLRIVQRTRFPATPVAYNWPSQGKVTAYGIDSDMSEWTIDHLTDFIRDLAGAVPEGFHLHIMAHSMGNGAVLLALARLNLTDRRLGQLILIAPDVDANIFKVMILHAGTFQRRTLYVSNHDLALRAAGFLHSGTSRAGDATKQYVVVEGVDTVDMSPLRAGFTGHSLYEYSQLMFDEFGEVLQDKPPTGRNLASCTVKSIQSFNVAHGTALPCVVYQLPR